jgi:hypothetical protein
MNAVLRVEHVNLPDGHLDFDDLEVPFMWPRPNQRTSREESQGGRVTVNYVGNEWYVFDITFKMTWRYTIENLNLVRLLRDVFWVYPFYRFDHTIRHECIWSDPKQFKEYYVAGLPAADWSLEVTWEEVIPGTCPIPERS